MTNDAGIDSAQIQVLQVKGLLAHTAMDEADIAQMVGYADVESMNDAFEKREGQLCASFRKEFWEEEGTPFPDPGNLKVIKAKGLLRYTAMDETAIAQMVGYETSEEFREDFEKTEGIKSSIYRQNQWEEHGAPVESPEILRFLRAKSLLIHSRLEPDEIRDIVGYRTEQGFIEDFIDKAKAVPSSVRKAEWAERGEPQKNLNLKVAQSFCLLEETDLKVEAVADAIGCKQSTLSFDFKRAMGRDISAHRKKTASPEGPAFKIISPEIAQSLALLEFTQMEIEELFEESGKLKRSTLQANFKETIGIPPSEYREKKDVKLFKSIPPEIARTLFLLEESEESIKDIGRIAGYSRSSAYSRGFESTMGSILCLTGKESGVNPAVFRQLYLIRFRFLSGKEELLKRPRRRQADHTDAIACIFKKQWACLLFNIKNFSGDFRYLPSSIFWKQER